MQRAPCSLQQTTDNVEKTIDNRQQGNRRQATCGMEQTPRRRRPKRATHPTGTVQDDMQEDASTREMKQETHGTAAFRVSSG
jgi:hypothetical protein